MPTNAEIIAANRALREEVQRLKQRMARQVRYSATRRREIRDHYQAQIKRIRKGPGKIASAVDKLRTDLIALVRDEYRRSCERRGEFSIDYTLAEIGKRIATFEHDVGLPPYAEPD